MSAQPVWKFVANLGDANPLDCDGLFVFIDETGVYCPEMEKLIVENKAEQDEDKLTYEIRRVLLQPCTYINGILSDNKFHPESAAWFAKPERKRKERPQDTNYLTNVADCIDMNVAELTLMFCSDVVEERARAWEAVFEYHGWENGNSYPLTGLTRAEVTQRYKGKGVHL